MGVRSPKLVGPTRSDLADSDGVTDEVDVSLRSLQTVNTGTK